MTEEHIINMTDKYCTREHYDKCIAEGKEVTSNVRVLCVLNTEQLFCVSAVINDNKLYNYTKYGSWQCSPEDECIHDLIKIPTKKEGWINIYNGDGYNIVFPTKELADKHGNNTSKIKCVKVWWYE